METHTHTNNVVVDDSYSPCMSKHTEANGTRSVIVLNDADAHVADVSTTLSRIRQRMYVEIIRH